MNQRPAKLKQHIGAKDRGGVISVYDLKQFLDQAVVELEKRGEVEAATRFEIFRDYVVDDIIELNKSFSFNRGISLGL